MEQQRTQANSANSLAVVAFVALLGMAIVSGWWFGLSVQQLYVARFVPVREHGVTATIRQQNEYTDLIDFMSLLRKSGKQASVRSVLVLAGDGYGDPDMEVLYELLPVVPELVGPNRGSVVPTIASLHSGDVVFSGEPLKLDSKQFKLVVDGPTHVYVRTPCTYCK